MEKSRKLDCIILKINMNHSDVCFYKAVQAHDRKLLKVITCQLANTKSIAHFHQHSVHSIHNHVFHNALAQHQAKSFLYRKK